MSRYFNLEEFRSQELIQEPFPHLVMKSFIRSERLNEVLDDYPKLDKPGSWPLHALKCGSAFQDMVTELKDVEVRKAFEEKYTMNLEPHPPMITARFKCRAKDGKVHTDSRTKIITVLIYLNSSWEHTTGNLRLLRSPDLNDFFIEVPPAAGTIITFLNTTNAWHGHESYSGLRSAIQLNWVRDQGVIDYEQRRHRISGFLKKINPFV